MQWEDHVHLHPIDMSYEELKKIHNDGDMNPALLDNNELRRDVTDGYYKMMKKIAEISNQNLLEILMLTFLAVEKLIQITSFHGLLILIRKVKINFNRGINF